MEELDLKDLFDIFWSKKGIIIFFLIIFIALGGVYSYMFKTPKFKSETSMLLVQTGTNIGTTVDGTMAITTTDLTINSKLVSTYSELIKSKSICRQVIDNLGLDMTENQLKACISVTAIDDTELIKIRVSNEDAKLARDVAAEIVEVFSEQVKEIYKIDNVNVIDIAELETEPYNINHTKDILIFAFAGIVVSAAYALVLNMFDTTIKDKERIEKATGLVVLTEIPVCNFNEEIAKRKGGRK